ncbi:hypothetical protein [Cryptosporangium sp. NPDC048952]|uniref:hypothetical protein n=1 Tax=Cryptosporangium sp. NPDC048952 TaxID=3363961 RepID=UPI003717117D
MFLGVPFFFPDQLAAYERQPTVMTVAYALFLAGIVALWPGVVAVATRIGATRPAGAVWGGALVMFGLFARAFHDGVKRLRLLWWTATVSAPPPARWVPITGTGSGWCRA